MNYEQVSDHLTKNNWQKYYSTFDKCDVWYKRFEGDVCKCNDDKFGIQVCISVYDNPQATEERYKKSYAINITGQKQDEQWVKLEVYSIGAEIVDIMDKQIKSLIAAWNLMAKEL